MDFARILQNRPIWAAVLAWAIAQIIKTILSFVNLPWNRKNGEIIPNPSAAELRRPRLRRLPRRKGSAWQSRQQNR